MQLFRSEEHLERWLEREGRERGGTLSPDQLWRLADTWYEHRLDADWKRRTAEEAQEVFTSIGLTGEFWALR